MTSYTSYLLYKDGKNGKKDELIGTSSDIVKVARTYYQMDWSTKKDSVILSWFDDLNTDLTLVKAFGERLFFVTDIILIIKNPESRDRFMSYTGYTIKTTRKLSGYIISTKNK